MGRPFCWECRLAVWLKDSLVFNDCGYGGGDFLQNDRSDYSQAFREPFCGHASGLKGIGAGIFLQTIPVVFRYFDMPHIAGERFLPIRQWNHQLQRESTYTVGTDDNGGPDFLYLRSCSGIEAHQPYFTSSWDRKVTRQCRLPECRARTCPADSVTRT